MFERNRTKENGESFARQISALVRDLDGLDIQL